MDECVLPGDKLGSNAEFLAGEGTYCEDGFIYASLMGKKTVNELPNVEQPYLIVSTGAVSAPQVGDIVLAVVLGIETMYASMQILAVGDRQLGQDFFGRLKRSDVRLQNADQVEISKCFRPGDLVRAEILSLGTQRSYYLSTTRQSCGVVLGYNSNSTGEDAWLRPYSFTQMECPVTGVVEPRKVAGSMV